MTHISFRVWRLFLILLAAACAPLAPKPEPVACPACPVCPACPPLPVKPAPETARYVPQSFDMLPGWSAASLAPSLRAFLVGCGKSATFRSVCEAAAAIPPGDETAARGFFEGLFTP